MGKGLTGKRFTLVVHRKGRRKGKSPFYVPTGLSSLVCPIPQSECGLSEVQPLNWVSKMGQPCQPVVLSNWRLQVWHQLESGQVPRGIPGLSIRLRIPRQGPSKCPAFGFSGSGRPTHLLESCCSNKTSVTVITPRATSVDDRLCLLSPPVSPKKKNLERQLHCSRPAAAASQLDNIPSVLSQEIRLWR